MTAGTESLFAALTTDASTFAVAIFGFVRVHIFIGVLLTLIGGIGPTYIKTRKTRSC
jgi:hypothetical protein